MNVLSRSYLLDTSIHVKRLLSSRWKSDNLDNIWDSVEPVASIYTWMEFKNAVIGALRFLVSVLEEIKAARSAAADDLVKIRLSEVIQQLNIETSIREKERRRRIANAYAARVLQENEAFPRVRNVCEVIDQLTAEAETLEKHWFFYFPRGGEPHRMEVIDRVGCQLGREHSPLHDGRALYHCRRDDLKCSVVQHLESVPIGAVARSVDEGALRVRDARLREGIQAAAEALRSGGLRQGASMGEKLCFPLGDAIIVSKARELKVGVMTADGDQRALADYWGVKSIFHSSRDNSLSTADDPH